MTYKKPSNGFQPAASLSAQGASAYKKDLTNTLLLTAHLGNPERDIKTIHIAVLTVKVQCPICCFHMQGQAIKPGCILRPT